MRSIYVRLNGGLGNQLFQFAAGYALSKKINSSLYLDCQLYQISEFDNYKRECEIDKVINPKDFTLISSTTPSKGEGISIEALSDSTVIYGSSFLIESPTLTIISITSTESKSPISGIGIGIKFAILFYKSRRLTSDNIISR